MTDRLNQLGKDLNQSKTDTSHVLTRPLIPTPLIERARDIFDAIIPFELVFDVPRNITRTSLDLFFMLPPSTQSTCCCGGCFCSICEYFVSDNVFTTTYPYYQSSVKFYQVSISTGVEFLYTIDDGDYTFTNSTTITSDITASAAYPIKICYVYRIPDCVNG